MSSPDRPGTSPSPDTSGSIVLPRLELVPSAPPTPPTANDTLLGMPAPPGDRARAHRHDPRAPSLRNIELTGRTPPAPGLGELAPTDLGARELYLNRELTYLSLCWRVMQEADDARIPLLERVKLISIVSSNIDELFQKRIGDLEPQVGAQLHTVTPDGRTPEQQIADCLELITRRGSRRARSRSSTASTASCAPPACGSRRSRSSTRSRSRSVFPPHPN